MEILGWGGFEDNQRTLHTPKHHIHDLQAEIIHQYKESFRLSNIFISHSLFVCYCIGMAGKMNHTRVESTTTMYSYCSR